MEKLRLIQCGIGGFGKSWLTDITMRSPDFEVVAVVDIMEENLTAGGEAMCVPPERRYRTLEEAVNQVTADAILTVTPPVVHVEHARVAFSRGLHLLTEKPFADTILHAQEMLQLGQESGCRLLVSQNYRYNAAFVQARKTVAEGIIGDLGSGHIDFYIAADFRKTFREKMQFPLLFDMAIHHFDLIRFVTGRNILKITVLSFNPPGSTFQHHAGLKALLELEGGIAFSYSGDWSARGRATGWSGDWRLQGGTGSLHVNEDGVTITQSEGWGKNPREEKMAVPPLDFVARAATLHEFSETIRTGRPSDLDGIRNIWSLAAVVAGVDSARTMRTVDVAQLIGLSQG